MAGFLFAGFKITLVATHVPKYVIERGLDGWTGPAILSLIGLFNIFGTLTMGYLADKYSKNSIEWTILSKRNYNYSLIFTRLKFSSYWIWNMFWFFMVSDHTSNFWNCCTSFWH